MSEIGNSTLDELRDDEELLSRKVKDLEFKMWAEGEQNLDTELRLTNELLACVKNSINDILNEVREEKGVWGLF